MAWLGFDETEKQTHIELRLYAPADEKILLDFNPLKESEEPDWNPMPEEWSCYRTPLRIYKQDYELLLKYINKIYPTKDAFDGTVETAFDLCFDNWIGKEDWKIIINEIKQDTDNHSDNEKKILSDFIEWLNEALKHTNIIVVSGNL